VASLAGQLTVVRLLVENGANVNSQAQVSLACSRSTGRSLAENSAVIPQHVRATVMCRNTPISSDGPTFHGENPI